jgi:hypothetical protein
MKRPQFNAPHFKFQFTATWAALLIASSTCIPVMASEFALAASPPRFELRLKQGERSRQVLELTNASPTVGSYIVKTADWALAPDNSVTFFDDLQPQSCRPWFAIERRELSIAGGRPYRYRFEINVPSDAPAGECRIAILLEGQEQVSRTEGGPPIPFSARLGVVIYLAIGDALPSLNVERARVQSIDGRLTPVLDIRNNGLAHGRIGGFLKGTDAKNTALEFSPSNMPILPGETRAISLTATRPGDPETTVQVQFPVVVTGTIEWGKGQTQSVEQRFAP